MDKLYDIEKELGIDRDYEGYDELITDYIKIIRLLGFMTGIPKSQKNIIKLKTYLLW